jgi:hypothetical protein
VFRGICDAPDDGAGGGCAHVTGAPPLQAIGTIQTATGLVTVRDARGAVAQVKVGDPVYRHDTIETGADGGIGILTLAALAFSTLRADDSDQHHCRRHRHRRSQHH